MRDITPVTSQAEALMHAGFILRAYHADRQINGEPIAQSLVTTAIKTLWTIASKRDAPDWLHRYAVATLQDLGMTHRSA